MLLTLKKVLLTLLAWQMLKNQRNCRTPQSAVVIQAEGYVQVNTYYPEHYGEAQEFLEELIAAMKGTGWYNNTDAQIDYFDIAYYLDINVGQWNKPYVCTAMAEAA